MALPVRPPFEPMLAKLTREHAARRARRARTSRSGTASAASCSATATTSISSRATRSRCCATSPSCASRCSSSCPSASCSTASSSSFNDERGLDFDALQLRQHPADSRVQKLAVEIPASYVAFDIARARRRVAARRAVPRTPRRRSRSCCAGASRRCTSRPRRPTATIAADWFDAFRRRGLRRRRRQAARRRLPARASARMMKVKHERTCDCVVAGYRVHKDGNGVGSFLLGLYDDDGALHHVGVASGMAAKLRTRAARRRRSRCARTRSTTIRGGTGPTRSPQAEAGGAHARRHEPLEREQGHVVGAAAHRAGRARPSTRAC